MSATMRIRDQRLIEARAGLASDVAWVAPWLPEALPPGWALVEAAPDGASYRHRRGMTVIVSGAVEGDGRRWLHVSLARPDRLPSYQDQALVKNLFIGRDREAYSVWARQSRHVNIHPFALHLWCPVDGPVLPDFTRGGRSI